MLDHLVTTGLGTRRPPLLVVHPGAELYGADRALLTSATALAGRFDVTVALPVGGPLARALEDRGLRVVVCPMPVLRNAALRPAGALRLCWDAVRGLVPAWRLLRRDAVAGVLVNTLTLPSWPLLARLAGRRSVCHVHEAERSAPLLLRRGMALCPVLADRVVANSSFTLDVLAEVAPRVRAHSTVVHNVVAGPTAVVAARMTLRGPVRLLFVGRISPRKGPHVAVAVLGELLDRGIDARLDFVGAVFEGYEWYETELRATIAHDGLTDRVAFHGFRSDVWPHLARADVVLMPSVAEESFGNTAVEAVLAARPLVVSDSSGLREAVAGFTSVQRVPPGRTGLWADAIQRVVADWSAFRTAAHADAGEARRRHDPHRYAARLIEVMASLYDHDASTLDSAPDPAVRPTVPAGRTASSEEAGRPRA